ncbi:SMP-30/gluconolactonase/LRE family protein [Asticcacaulis sp. AC460]|uniref:SMP-30/gluconolactonase/LRE family protein n=1 Tax=Asticcacaulis sp. AC460 TaxID=1282360 RepID=UPI001F2467E3|nr:SMP-30/gluconolactonase/LRE family protein [Asticcacaulis sp. AC460]
MRSSAHLDVLYAGCRWAEGPVWFPMMRSLVWSDIPNDRMLRWDETTGGVGVFRSPTGYSNGNTVDRQGRLVTCEHGGRRVTRTEHDGSVTVIVDRFDGGRLNSPNDVVVSSDGSVWFTDPTYGIDTDYEGHKAVSEQDGSHVYRVDPLGHVTRVLTDFIKPNGLAFSPDEKRLYVVDSGRTHVPDGPRHIRVFDVAEDWSLSGGDVFADNGNYDGLRIDSDGRVWTSATEAVHCYEPDGTLLGEIFIGEPVSNVCFGGAKRNRLFITATTSVYAVMLAVNGARTF